MLFGLIIGAVGLVFIDPLALLLGAKTEATIRSTIDYMRYILYATPFMTGAIVMNNQLRMQGNAFFAMIGLTSGAIVNIVLDPILIYSAGDTLAGGSVTMPFGAGMGVGGAALATAVSQILSFFILFIGVTKSDNIKIHLKNFSPRLYYIKNIVRGGLPSLGRQGVSSIAVACLNHAVGIYVQDSIMIDAVQAAMTGVSKIMNFLTSALTGFGQGFQPVCGFNYGAGKYKRVIRAYTFCVKVSTVVLVAIAAVGFAFAEPITQAIAGSSELAGDIAAVAFRAQLVVFPLHVVGYNVQYDAPEHRNDRTRYDSCNVTSGYRVYSGGVHPSSHHGKAVLRPCYRTSAVSVGGGFVVVHNIPPDRRFGAERNGGEGKIIKLRVGCLIRFFVAWETFRIYCHGIGISDIFEIRIPCATFCGVNIVEIYIIQPQNTRKNIRNDTKMHAATQSSGMKIKKLVETGTERRYN